MSFEEQALLLPQWVQYWINFIVVVPILVFLILLFGKMTRKDALIVLLLTVPAFAGTIILHAQFGMVRLLGLGHVVFWTPLAWYLFKRLRKNPPPPVFRIAMTILLVTIVVALIFDYADVVRWLLGERDSVV